MFEQNSSAAHLANLHCNLTANVHLAHYLYGRLLSRQTPGCLVFTSSSAGFIPTPFAAMYATSKAAISAFAARLGLGLGLGLALTLTLTLTCVRPQWTSSVARRSACGA